MAPFQTSSGSLSADRRLSYAEALLADGDARAAAELMSETMSSVPEWTGGWVRLGEMAEAAGDIDLAKSAYGRAIATDPADHFGASVRLDLLRPVPLAERVPAAHVEALFDDYAARFEQSLVGKLGYDSPTRIAAMLPAQLGRVVDLGCGTGLFGEAIAGRYDWLGGYDLSQKMLDQAARKGLYHHLEQKDLAALAVEGAYDLIAAADVFIYLGALERIVGWAAGSLAVGGQFVFTVERHEGSGFLLQQSFRYAHSQAYVANLLSQAGFGAVQFHETVIRMDRGAPVYGYIVLASGVGQRLDREGEAESVAA